MCCFLSESYIISVSLFFVVVLKLYFNLNSVLLSPESEGCTKGHSGSPSSVTCQVLQASWCRGNVRGRRCCSVHCLPFRMHMFWWTCRFSQVLSFESLSQLWQSCLHLATWCSCLVLTSCGEWLAHIERDQSVGFGKRASESLELSVWKIVLGSPCSTPSQG